MSRITKEQTVHTAFTQLQSVFRLKKHKITAVIMALVMIATMIPAMSLTSFAAGWADVPAGGVAFIYGTDGFMNVTMPSTVDYYTYGSLSGSDCSQTASNAASLPDSGWNWAVQKSADGSVTMILNDFVLDYSGTKAIDGLMLKCSAKLELRGDNEINIPLDFNNAAIKADGSCLTVYGDGSLSCTGSYGIDSQGQIIISSGAVVLNSKEMGAFSTGNITLNGGNFTSISSSDAAIHCNHVVFGNDIIAVSGNNASSATKILTGSSPSGKYFHSQNTTVNYTMDFSQNNFVSWSGELVDFSDSDASGNGWSWDCSEKTLSLSRLNFSTSEAVAIMLPDGAKIIVTGKNVIKSSCLIAVRDSTTMRGDGNLTICGDGTLSVSGGSSFMFENGNQYRSYGIYAEENLTINSGTINANGGTVSAASVGIYAKNIAITGGTVNATGGTSDVDSMGIYAKNVAITGGTVNATGGTAGLGIRNINTLYSAGIMLENGAAGNVSISGNSTVVNATGGIANNFYTAMSSGIITLDGTINVTGGTVTATGGNAYSLSREDCSLGIHAGRYRMITGEADGLTVSAGSVTAVGKTYGVLYSVLNLNGTGTLDMRGNVSALGWNSSGNPFNYVEYHDIMGCSHNDTSCSFTKIADARTILNYKHARFEPNAWKKLQAEMAVGGDIKLTQNVICGDQTLGALVVPSGVTATLDLNGFTIDRGLKNETAKNDGLVFYNNGNLNIADTSAGKTGKITGGNNTNNGGGVFNNGILFMISGTISGNMSDNNGGGVYNNGTFLIAGGTISCNMSDKNGGGVYNNDIFILSDCTVSGNVVGAAVTGGVLSGGKLNNVYLPIGKTIKVTGKITGNSIIGVTVADEGYATTIATCLSNSMYLIKASDAAKFISDNADYETVFTNGEVVLQKIPDILTAADFDFNAPTELTYDFSVKEVSVSPKSGVDAGAVTVKYYDSNGVLLSGTPIHVGTYTVKIDAEGSRDYKAATDLTDASWTFEITPRTLNVSVADVIINKGQSIPELTVDVTGFCGSDTESLNGFSKPSASVSGTVDTSDLSLQTFTVNYIGGSATSDYTFNTNTTANITINAVDVTSNDYTVNCDLSKWQNKDIVITPANGYTWISEDGTTWKSSLSYSVEGMGTEKSFCLKKTDGTISENEIIHYSLDKTAPDSLKVQYNTNEFKTFLNTVSFGIFFKENVDVTANASDAMSGIASYKYYASDSAVTDFSSVTWQDSMTLTQNSKKIVYVKAIDNAGNESVVNFEGIVIYSDSTVTPQGAVFDKNTENQADIDFTMTLNGNTLNEIKNGNYVLVNGTDYTVSGNKVTVKKEYLALCANGNAALTFSFFPMGVENNNCISSDSAVIIIKDTTHYHSMELVSFVSATCTTDGNIKYWHCTDCDRYFSDADGKTEITLSSTKILRTGHDFSGKIVINAEGHGYECTHSGCTGISSMTAHTWFGGSCTTQDVCSVCGAVGLSHGHKWHSATCTSPKTCEVCGVTEGAELGHHYVRDMTDANNSRTTIVYKCTLCGNSIYLYATETDAPTEFEYLPGDINMDGNINAADARIALRIAAKLETAANEKVFSLADVNKDVYITAADAREILRISAKLSK